MLLRDPRFYRGLAWYWGGFAAMLTVTHFLNSNLQMDWAGWSVPMSAAVGAIESFTTAISALLAFTIAWSLPLEAGRRKRNLALAVLLTLLVALLDASLEQGLKSAVQAQIPLPFAQAVLVLAPAGTMYVAPFVGVGYAFEYFLRSREQALSASRLESRLARAQLEVLKVQLHPHFLFNTLNSVAALMHRDVEAADRMLTGLGEMLRHALRQARTHEVPLREEMEFTRLYLEIQQVRFGPRLTVSCEVQPGLEAVPVPHLLLQPLVENALQHGVSRCVGGGWVRIRVERCGGELRISVHDSGPGLPDDRPPREGALGLTNTRARLEQMFGTAQRLELRHAAGEGTVVTVAIPLRPHERTDALPGAGKGAGCAS